MNNSFERRALALLCAGAITIITPLLARAEPILGPNITPANQSQTVTEGTGPQTFTYTISNPNAFPVTFAGVLAFQLSFLGGDETDVPLNFRIGGGSCFVNFPGGPAATIPGGGNCTLNFTYTTAIDELENNDAGSSRLRFATAFQENVDATTTNAFGFITVEDPVPEPSTAALLASVLPLAIYWARKRRASRNPGAV